MHYFLILIIALFLMPYLCAIISERYVKSFRHPKRVLLLTRIGVWSFIFNAVLIYVLLIINIFFIH